MTISRRGTALLLATYAAVQFLVLAIWANGPFTDEAIYIVAGRRILEGFAFQKEYPDFFYWKWFQGSPFLWPIPAALAYFAGGLFGARALAVLLSTYSLLLFLLSWKRLFSSRIAWWGAVGLALNGHFFHLGHFAGRLHGKSLLEQDF